MICWLIATEYSTCYVANQRKASQPTNRPANLICWLLHARHRSSWLTRDADGDHACMWRQSLQPYVKAKPSCMLLQVNIVHACESFSCHASIVFSVGTRTHTPTLSGLGCYWPTVVRRCAFLRSMLHWMSWASPHACFSINRPHRPSRYCFDPSNYPSIGMCNVNNKY